MFLNPRFQSIRKSHIQFPFHYHQVDFLMLIEELMWQILTKLIWQLKSAQQRLIYLCHSTHCRLSSQLLSSLHSALFKSKSFLPDSFSIKVQYQLVFSHLIRIQLQSHCFQQQIQLFCQSYTSFKRIQCHRLKCPLLKGS